MSFLQAESVDDGATIHIGDEFLICDHCEARLDRSYETRKLARFWATAKGWTHAEHRKFSGVLIEDRCPDCSKERT